jgi:propionate CoA-transferase
MIDGPSQFDFYSGGGLDVAFLGFGQIDQEGNVNVSKLDGVTVGPGGFIDIAQNAKKVVFCGTFDTKGSKLRTGNGELSVEKPGEIRKLVQQVDQVTFSGKQALKQKQEVIYATERALFRLTEAGLVLEELAPGVELEKDVLQQMDFVPIISKQLKRMDSSLFMEQE